MEEHRRKRGTFRPTFPLREEFAYILDFMPQGNPFDRHPEHRRSPVAQAIGDRFFTLMELTCKESEYFEIGERIYVGYDYVGRGPIKSVIAPIEYSELTNVARQNLKGIIEQIVREKERYFVNVFNIAEPVTLKMHSLELLPGVGKKSLQVILEERKLGMFKSFKDLDERLSLRGVKLGDPASIIAERIIKELEGQERYYLFVRPPREEPGVRYLRFLDVIYGMGPL